MKLIFSFWFISPALAQSGAEETGGGVLIFLVILGIIFLVVRNRKRVAANKRAAEEAEIARQLSREREKLIKDQPPVVIRTYKGTQEQATKLFQAEGVDMAALGYVPTTQSWAPMPVSWVRLGGVRFYGQPHGTLTVTYARQTASTSERQTASVEEKTCPQCAERVKAAALVCRFCGYQFRSEKVLPPAGRA